MNDYLPPMTTDFGFPFMEAVVSFILEYIYMKKKDESTLRSVLTLTNKGGSGMWQKSQAGEQMISI